ncbi:MAG: hypothetical protein R3F14_26020 [Polyangiaceae bacterium]
MRTASLCLLLVAPLWLAACARGSTLGDPGDGAGAAAPGEDTGGEVENEPDPGSPDPGEADPGAEGDTGEDCAHDPCFPGVALDPNCHPCVWDVCEADPYCCMTGWNQQCADEALGCGCSGGPPDPGGAGGGDPGPEPEPEPEPEPDPEPDPTGTCSHGLCDSGDALDPSCDPCADAICQADDYCCTVEWDFFCVFDAVTSCPDSCL